MIPPDTMLNLIVLGGGMCVRGHTYAPGVWSNDLWTGPGGLERLPVWPSLTGPSAPPRREQTLWSAVSSHRFLVKRSYQDQDRVVHGL